MTCPNLNLHAVMDQIVRIINHLQAKFLDGLRLY